MRCSVSGFNVIDYEHIIIDYAFCVTTDRSSVAGGETQRWQHNDDGRTRGARMVVSPEQLQREMKNMQHARGRRRGVRIFVP